MAVALLLGACSSGSSAPNAAQAPGQISSVYQTVFSFTSKSVPPKLAVIQDGSSVKSSFTTAIDSALASNTSGAKVLTTTLLSSSACSSAKVPSPCAKVSYELLTPSGSVELAPPSGYAIYTSGKWYVAKVTVCYLLSLFYAASGGTGSPAGCSASSS